MFLWFGPEILIWVLDFFFFFFFLVTVWTWLINPRGYTKFGREAMWVSLSLYLNLLCSYFSLHELNLFFFFFWMIMLNLWQHNFINCLFCVVGCIRVHCLVGDFLFFIFDFRYDYCYCFVCDDWSSIIDNWKFYNCSS